MQENQRQKISSGSAQILISQFEEDIVSALNKDPFTFSDCEKYFRQLMEADFLTDFLNSQLNNLASGNTHSIQYARMNRIVLAEKPQFILYLRVQKPYAEVPAHLYGLFALETIGVCKLLSDTKVALQCFEQPMLLQSESSVRSESLTPLPDRIIGEGEFTSFLPGRDVYQIKQDSGPAILLILAIKQNVPMAWEFDAKTLLPVRAMVTSSEASRLSFTAKMLAEFGDHSSVPAIRLLLEHPEHHVRWSAVQAIARINGEEGISALKQLRDDPHPHIQRAVARELERIAAYQASA